MRYLLDSDWAISYLHNTPRFVSRIDALEPMGIAISVISLAEMYEGALGARDPEQSQRDLDAFVERLDLLIVDEQTARIVGRERRRLRVEGLPIDGMDLLIAATALRYDLTLLTNNRRHFERIPALAVESV